MGTHPIFESDFDCLTEKTKKCLLANPSKPCPNWVVLKISPKSFNPREANAQSPRCTTQTRRLTLRVKCAPSSRTRTRWGWRDFHQMIHFFVKRYSYTHFS